MKPAVLISKETKSTKIHQKQKFWFFLKKNLTSCLCWKLSMCALPHSIRSLYELTNSSNSLIDLTQRKLATWFASFRCEHFTHSIQRHQYKLQEF